MDSKKRVYNLFRSLFVAILVSIFVFYLSYTISCWLSPPYVIGENNEKHPTMPIGQTILATACAVLTVLVWMWVTIKRYIKDQANKS